MGAGCWYLSLSLSLAKVAALSARANSRRAKGRRMLETIAELRAEASACFLSARTRGQGRLDFGRRVALNVLFISEAAQPADFRFPAKPGHLPLGVVAVGLLRRLHRLLAGEISLDKLQRLLVAE